jgi:hypothetical protein
MSDPLNDLTPLTRDELDKLESVAELPCVLPGHWTSPEGREMAGRYATMTRANLLMDDRSDLGLANALYLVSGEIAIQTAAKERMRWLSVQLALAEARIRTTEAERDAARKHLNSEYHARKAAEARAQAAEAALRLALPTLDDDLASFQGDTPPARYEARGFVCLDDLSCDHGRWKECEATLNAMAAIRAILPADEWTDSTYAESQEAVEFFARAALKSQPLNTESERG